MGRRDTQRIHGWAAAGAVLAQRLHDVRCVYLRADRVPSLASQLKALASQRRAYRIVEDSELEALAQSPHHEGVVVDVQAAPTLDRFASSPGQWLLLDRVRNPHNVGALLRSAAHFGVRGIWAIGATAAAGAAARVAEGGAEFVPYGAVDRRTALDALRKARGFTVFGTSAASPDDLFEVELPSKVVWVLGSEAAGIDGPVAKAVDRWVRIPGTGHVESLNVSVSGALVMAEYARRHPKRGPRESTFKAPIRPGFSPRKSGPGRPA